MPASVDSLEQLTHRDVHRMMQRLQQDVLMIRKRLGPVPVVLLADGAPEIWNLFARHLDARGLGIEPVRLIDAWHALEYIAAAARLLESREKIWPGTFRRWRTWLLHDPNGAARIVEALERSGMRGARCQRQVSGQRCASVLPESPGTHELRGCAQARLADRHAVEATCKSLVSVRMKRCGARWKHQSGNEILQLQLRALQLSDRWEPAMERILSPLRKPVHVISRSEALGLRRAA